MRKFTCLIFMLLAGYFAKGQAVYVPPLSAGHTIAPTFSFLNKACTQVMTVSKAEAIVWDLQTKKPMYRATLPKAMIGYNPYDESLTVVPVPSADLTQVIIELKGGDKKNAFIFDMKTGKLSLGDGGFNPWISSFTTEGDFVIMRDLRTPGKNPDQLLQTFLKPDGGTNVVVNEIKKFAYAGFSQSGGLYWGKNTENDRFILYNPINGKITTTKLKYNDKIKHFFYYTDTKFSDKWISRVPSGKDWINSYYEIASGEVIYFTDKDGIKGPYAFSDDGKLAVYYNTKTYEYHLREPLTQKVVYSIMSPEGISQAAHSRIQEGTNKMFILGDNGTQMYTYGLAQGKVLDKFNTMADAQVISMSKATLETAQKINDVDKNALQDFNTKNFLVNFAPMSSFRFNLSTAQNLKGTDITNLPFTKAHYTNGLGSNIKILSVLGLGKLGECQGNSIVFGVVRAVVNGKQDRTLFFIEKLGPNGESLSYENLGLMEKITNGGNFMATIDISISSANNKTAVVVDQKFTNAPKSNYKKTFMIDLLSCT
ncbi:MAG: hypothetical protein EOP48_18935, partial [Sphingobacteriales bacterium]